MKLNQSINVVSGSNQLALDLNTRNFSNFAAKTAIVAPNQMRMKEPKVRFFSDRNDDSRLNTFN